MMTMQKIMYSLGLVFATACATLPAQSLTSQSDAFRYQGQLSANGALANGTYQFTFTLYNAVTGGSVVSAPIQQPISVVNGVFTTDLNFGAGISNGQHYWLEIKVGTTTGNAVSLPNRQAIDVFAPAVYAQSSAASASTLLSLPFSGAISFDGSAFQVVNLSAYTGVSGGSVDGDGVVGKADAAGGTGVYGFGEAGAAGVAGSSYTGAGVHGQSQTSGVRGESVGAGPGADGIHGHTNAGAGQGSGVAGFNDGDGSGVFGLSALGDGVTGIASQPGVSGVAGVNTGSGNGVYASSASGYALYADGPVTQRLNQDGIVKFLVVVDADAAGNYFIASCFNSQVPASQARVQPCNIDFQIPQPGIFVFDFHNNVQFHIASVTTIFGGPPSTSGSVCGPPVPACMGLSATQMAIATIDALDGALENASFHLVVQ